MNDFRFDIKRYTETVWTFYFENEDKKIAVFASDFMNPMKLLFYNLRMFLKNAQTNAVISMIDEPEENIWKLNLSEGIIEIEIFNFEDYCGDIRDLTKGEKIFSGKMKFTRFLNQFINAVKPFENQTEREDKISDLLNELIELRRNQK